MNLASFAPKVLEKRLKQDPLAPAWFALLSELLCLGYIGFAALVSLEALLPTFVTARLSLTLYLLVLLLLTALALAFGKVLDIGFRSDLSLRQPLLVTGILWFAILLALSLLKFPWWAILIGLAGYLGVLFLLWKMFSPEKSKKKEA